MISEVWKDVPNYEGRYEVSNFGRVRSLTHKESFVNRWGGITTRIHKGRELKPKYDGKKNYLHVGLCDNGKVNVINIHRLVAQVFIENPNNYPEVNHKDEDKTNNRVDNLEWCDRTYNNNYGSKVDTSRGVNNSQSKLTEVDVLDIRRRRSSGESLHALSEEYHVTPEHICAITKMRVWRWLK